MLALTCYCHCDLLVEKIHRRRNSVHPPSRLPERADCRSLRTLEGLCDAKDRMDRSTLSCSNQISSAQPRKAGTTIMGSCLIVQHGGYGKYSPLTPSAHSEFDQSGVPATYYPATRRLRRRRRLGSRPDVGSGARVRVPILPLGPGRPARDGDTSGIFVTACLRLRAGRADPGAFLSA